MTTPSQIGDYRIVDVLGRGGMGVVYRATDARGDELAVKTVHVATESTLASIRREIQTLGELRHPGVVAIRDHGVAGGVPWYAMDLLRGRTLRDDLRAWFPGPVPGDADTSDLRNATLPPTAETSDLRRPGHLAVEARAPWPGTEPPASLPRGSGRPSQPIGAAPGSIALAAATPAYSLVHVATLFRKICEPLAYVHGRGVIHRDLSPANIFLVGVDQPVVFDFGLAAQFRTDSARDVLEVGGQLRGTAHYMSPEQARGEIVDARADLYAIGCMLYEALTGRPPFLGESPLAVVMQHLEIPPDPPSTIAPALPAVFDGLVLHLLAKAPRDRIGYAGDVANALEQLGATPGLTYDVTLAPRPYTYRPGLAGRTDLVAAHDDFLRALARGTGGCVALVGESGVGKTRLAGEIATRALEHDLRVITGECEPIGLPGDELRAAPLHPLRPLLRAVADRCSDDPPAAARLLGGSAGLLAVYEPALAAFAAPVSDGFTSTSRRVARPDPSPAGGPGATAGDTASGAHARPAVSGTVDHVEPAAARFRVLAVLRDLIAELAREAPLLLVLDDLQWADELTIAVLRSLGRDFLVAHRVFVLATARAEETTAELDAMFDALGAVRLTVPRLDRAAIGAIVRDMLALEEEATTLTEFVATRSEGNPLFAAEYVRTAVDEGVLLRDATGRWRLVERNADSFDALPTPDSVQALVGRRLRSLSAPARALTLAAAVLGRSCTPELLAAVGELGDEPARTAIAELVQRHVLEDLPDGGLRFAHDKLREQAYAEIDEPARRRLHRRAAELLERHYHDGDLALHLSQLAHHWETAGELERAADYLERAADHGLDSAAYGAAAALLRHLVDLPVTVPAQRRAGWERRLGEACFALGDLAGCATHTESSLARLGRPLPATRLGLTLRVAAGVARRLWSHVVGVTAARRRVGPLVDAALASARMTSCYFFRGDSLALVGAALSAVNLAERAGTDVPIAEIYSQLGYIAGLARLHRVATAYFSRGRDTAEATRDPIGLGRVHYTEAAFHVGIGGWGAARDAANHSLEIALALRNPQEAEIAHTILGHVEFATGEYEASRRSAVTLHDSAHARANSQHEAWGLYTQARAALYLGELDDAIRDFERAMVLLAGRADHASHVLCGGMLASALARAGEPARARAMADATTERIGSRRPPVFTISEGFIGAADAYLELARRGDRDAERAAAVALDNLVRLARVFPIAAPAASTLSGMYALQRGAPRRAARALQRGLALAERLAMPYDQAVAHRGLAAVAGGDHAEQARRLFTRLGCRWHLDGAAS